MNKKNKIISALAIAALALSMHSCKPNNVVIEPTAEFNNGVFVVEEGMFNGGTGTLSYLNLSNNKVTNDLFKYKNGYALGNVVQSMNIIGNTGYVVVNNANKIETFDASNLKAKGALTGFDLPRYIAKVSSAKAYVTQWGGGGQVAVLNLTNNQIEKKITVGEGAEQILVQGDRAYITCNGGFGNNDTLAVVNTTTDALDSKIYVGPNPESIITDASNNIWILCKGKWNASFSALSETGKLVKLNSSNTAVDKTIDCASLYSQPENLVRNGAGNQFYLSYDGGIYNVAYTASTLPAAALINGYFYGLGFDAKNNTIYTADAKNFSTAGMVRRYKIDGAIIDSFTSGIVPSDFYFSVK